MSPRPPAISTVVTPDPTTGNTSTAITSTSADSIKRWLYLLQKVVSEIERHLVRCMHAVQNAIAPYCY